MAQRKAGKGNFRHELGTRRDGFFRLPQINCHKDFGNGNDVRRNGDPKVGREERNSQRRYDKFRAFLSKMHERAARFDPFPTS